MKYRSLYRLGWLVFLATTLGVVTSKADPVGTDAPKADTARSGSHLLDQHTLEKRTAPVLKALNLGDSQREIEVRSILERYFQDLAAWHDTHDHELSRRWSEWTEARVPSHKDDAKAAAAASEIDAVYATLKPQHDAMLQQLASVLSPAQIDHVKDALTKTPGFQRTYDAYLQIIPDLTDAQKTFIREKLLLAREQAMDAFSNKEKVNLFKKQKVQIEAYVQAQGYDWKTLYGAFAARIKAASAKSP